MNDKLAKKVNDLETTYGLLQHDFEAQNETILWLTSRVTELEKVVTRLTGQVGDLESAPETAPADEPPPHY